MGDGRRDEAVRPVWVVTLPPGAIWSYNLDLRTAARRHVQPIDQKPDSTGPGQATDQPPGDPSGGAFGGSIPAGSGRSRRQGQQPHPRPAGGCIDNDGRPDDVAVVEQPPRKWQVRDSNPLVGSG